MLRSLIVCIYNGSSMICSSNRPSIKSPQSFNISAILVQVDQEILELLEMARFSAANGVLVAMLLTLSIVMQVTEAKSYYEQIGPYYQHDTIDGWNASDVVAFAGSENYTKSGPKMGAITVFDDPITVSPDSNSTMVGRAQGIQVVDSLDGRNSLISLTLLLANGTMSFQGAFTAYTKTSGYGRLHFLGGTGEFQSVTRGYFDMTDYKNTILNITAAYHKAKRIS